MEQMAMIQINCEVRSTNHVRVNRDLLAGVGYPRSTGEFIVLNISEVYSEA